MRAYRVEGGSIVKYAGTSALAREARQQIVETAGVKKKDVNLEEVDIPMGKDALLEFLNKLIVELRD